MPKTSPKKILDIIPPEKIEKKISSKIETKKRESLQFHFSFPLKSFLIVVFVLILGIISSSFFFQNAKIIIWPKAQEMNFEGKITVDLESEQVDSLTNVIPGKILSDEQKASQEFSASGETTEETKAQGAIRVYNAYSTSSQTLVATTRFVSADGKLFRSIERVTIPGGTYSGGKLEPGFLDIQVQADQSGEEYNIDPSTFSLPALAGTVRYATFYGKSFEAMSGGFKGKTSQVTKEDIERAERTLKDRLLEAIKISLKNKSSEEMIILEAAAEKEFSDIVFSAEPEEKKESFISDGKISFKVIAFKKSDLEKFVEDYISFQISKDQQIDLRSLNISYTVENTNIEQGKMSLNLNVSGRIYYEVPEENLEKDLAGKSLFEAKEFLAQDPRIIKSEINFWPFWVRKVPQSVDKIEVEQVLD